MSDIHLSEVRHADGATWIEVWHCHPPRKGMKYQVIRQTWNDDFTERHIYEWKRA